MYGLTDYYTLICGGHISWQWSACRVDDTRKSIPLRCVHSWSCVLIITVKVMRLIRILLGISPVVWDGYTFQWEMYTSVADLGFWKGEFQCAHDWSHKVCKACTLGGCAHVGTCTYMSPQENIWFQIFWDRFWWHFGGETARFGWPTAKSSHCVWRSYNLKAWLRFALQRQQSSCEEWEKSV